MNKKSIKSERNFNIKVEVKKPTLIHNLPKKEQSLWRDYMDGKIATLSGVLGPILS